MFYTVDEVAKMLNLHPRTIRRYIDKGQLYGERIGGSWRISEDALKEMFDGPKTKEAITKHLGKHSEDMLEQYLLGKHRLQQNNHVMLYVLTFNPQKEPWVQEKMPEIMTKLNRLGQDAIFDFTMTGSEQGMFRLTLIATPDVLAVINEELKYPIKG